MKRGSESSESNDGQAIEMPEEERLKQVVDVLASLCAKNSISIERPNEVLPRLWPRFLHG